MIIMCKQSNCPRRVLGQMPKPEEAPYRIPRVYTHKDKEDLLKK